MASTDPVLQYLYPEDQTGTATTNLVKGERQTLNPPDAPTDQELESGDFAIRFHFAIPFATPYFRDSLKIKYIPTGQYLTRGTDYACGHEFQAASYELQNVLGGIYGSILFFDPTLSGQIELEYQTLGGNWTLDENKIFEILANRLVDPRSVTYDEVSGKPEVFPPVEHNHPADDFTGMKEMLVAVAALVAAVQNQTDTYLQNPPILFGLYYKKSEINTMIADIMAKFNTYYTASEIDQKLQELIENGGGGGTGPGEGDYYTKGEMNLLLTGIRNQFNSYYTQQQINDLLDVINQKLDTTLTTDDLDGIKSDVATAVLAQTESSLNAVVDTVTSAFEAGIITLNAR
jgi:hypothetical protein